MNTLSLIILLISITQNIGWVLVLLMFFSGAATVASLAIWVIGGLIARANDPDNAEAANWLKPNGPHEWAGRVFKRAVSIWLTVVLLSVVIPEKNYAIMIAASEVGERVIETDAAKKFATDVTGLSGEATDLLRQYIKNETERLKAEAAKAAEARSKSST